MTGHARRAFQAKITQTCLDGKDATGFLLAESYWEPVEGGTGHTLAFRQIWHWLREVIEGKRLVAVGHRVVHGGEQYAQLVLIDDQVLADLARLIPLVPLHQPHNLAAIRAVSKSHPQLRQVACFDTAFHRQRPAVNERFGLPFELFEKGVRRYGFHGISYEYIVTRLEKIAPGLARQGLLGIEINQEANERRELKISVGDTTPSVWVIPTDEGAQPVERVIRIWVVLVRSVDGMDAIDKPTWTY